MDDLINTHKYYLQIRYFKIIGLQTIFNKTTKFDFELLNTLHSSYA